MYNKMFFDWFENDYDDITEDKTRYSNDVASAARIRGEAVWEQYTSKYDLCIKSY